MLANEEIKINTHRACRLQISYYTLDPQFTKCCLIHADKYPVDECNRYRYFKYISVEQNFFHNEIFIGVTRSNSLMSDQLNTQISIFQCCHKKFTDLHGVNNNASKNNKFQPLRHQFAKEYLRTSQHFSVFKLWPRGS